MSDLSLVSRTRERYHAFFARYEQDPALFADPARFAPYVYDEAKVEAFRRKRESRTDYRGWFLMEGNEIVGDIGFKRIDRDRAEAEIEICLRDDRCKGRGLGTAGLRLALEKAREMGLKTVRASILKGNLRSRRLFARAGFRPVSEDEFFLYERLEL